MSICIKYSQISNNTELEVKLEKILKNDVPEIIEVKGISMGVNYGTEKTRFPSPVRVGSKLSATGTVLSVEEAKGGIKMVFQIVIQAEGAEKPACIVESISVYLAVPSIFHTKTPFSSMISPRAE